MFGQPKRNTRNPCCGQRGQCSCVRRRKAIAAQDPQAAPRTCTRTCQPNRGRHAACGRTIRGGVCPCPHC